MKNLVKETRAQLTAAGTEENRKTSQRFFKEEVKVHGVKSADVRKIAKEGLKRLKDADKKTVFALCGELWKSGFIEEGGVACEWCYARRAEYEPADMDVFEKWIDKYVTNWASCDTLCNHSVAALVEAYPELLQRLRQWTASKNRWKKRAAAVTLIIPARNGLFLDDVFFIAEALLADPDDMVQKGYGWALKAASEAHRDEVYKYVVDRKDAMPRTAYRYALEKMPKEMRTAAMKKDA